MDSEYLPLTPESKQKMQPKQTSQLYKIINQPNYQNTSFNIGTTLQKIKKRSTSFRKKNNKTPNRTKKKDG